MSKSKNLKQKQEIVEQEIIEQTEEIPAPAPKVKKILTQEQLDNLAKARELFLNNKKE
jgi:hypothetical protein